MHRLQLGATLRRWREAANISREDAAKELECSVSKITKIEIGSAAPTILEAKALLRLYEASVEETDAALALTREARKRDPVRVPDWVRAAYGLEAQAAEIQTFEQDLVPGLLQTDDYARAVTAAADPTRSASEVERMVRLRRERRARLLGEAPPQLSVVLDEAVIRRKVGGAEVMHEQLAQLIELAALPTVSLQVLPYDVGAHAAMGSAFTILRMPEGEHVVYLEDLWSADYVKGRQQVSAYSVVFDRITEVALDEKGTVAMIERVMGELR
jgi:transcriptional regulator with XRE-family HTH domain